MIVCTYTLKNSGYEFIYVSMCMRNSIFNIYEQILLQILAV